MFQKDVCMKSPICRGVHDSPLVAQKALACLLHLTIDWHWLVFLSGHAPEEEKRRLPSFSIRSGRGPSRKNTARR